MQQQRQSPHLPSLVLLAHRPVGHQHAAVELEAAAKRQLPHALALGHTLLRALNIRQLIPHAAHTAK
jgi:hypothetical protein